MNLAKPIDNLVNEFMKLPGVGRKTAFRYALHCLEEQNSFATSLPDAISEVKSKITFCKECKAPTENNPCDICSNPVRSNSQICVVESYKDMIAIESTHQFNGKYHILGGVISPVDGIGAEELSIESLVQKVASVDNSELIMALNPTIEGDTTIYYISKILSDYNVTITTISRGISFGGELDYTDHLTLGRSIVARQPYEQLIRK